MHKMQPAHLLHIQGGGDRKALKEEKVIYDYVTKTVPPYKVSILNIVISMYAGYRGTSNAQMVFDSINEHNLLTFSAMIGGHIKSGHGNQAIELFQQMKVEGMRPDKVTFIYALKACSNLGSSELGKWVHASILNEKFELDIFVGTTLVDMYAKSGNISYARQVFDRMCAHDVVLWTAMITGYAQCGDGKEALRLYMKMQEEGLKANRVTLLSALGACGSIAHGHQGKRAHACILKFGWEADVSVGNTIIDMYTKSGNVEEAHLVFLTMPMWDVVTWTVMIAAYGHYENGSNALLLFMEMMQRGVRPNRITFSSVLSACTCMSSLAQGKRVHATIISDGCNVDVVLANSVIHMYGKCGSLHCAREVFDRVIGRNVVSWNTMIGSYIGRGKTKEACVFLWEMQHEGVKPDSIALLNVLIASPGLKDVERIHSYVASTNYNSDVVVKSVLVDAYAKRGNVDAARQVFDNMFINIVSWTSAIRKYDRIGDEVPGAMEEKGVKSIKFALINILNACAAVGAFEKAKQIHAYIVGTDHELNAFVGSALIDMYCKCGSRGDAWVLLNRLGLSNLIFWNALILGYLLCGKDKEAFYVFEQLQIEGIKPDNITLVNLLRTCANMAALEHAKYFHAQIVQGGYNSDVHVASTLVHAYAKCQSMADASLVFGRMQTHDVMSWTAIISGHAQHYDGPGVLKLLAQMKKEEVDPDNLTFVGVLSACANLEEGKWIHACILGGTCKTDCIVASLLIDMYFTCGCIEEAWWVFHHMPVHDVIIWNAMIAGHVQHRCEAEALKMFEWMQQKGVRSNHALLVSILNACASIMALGRGKKIHFGIIRSGMEANSSVSSALVDMYAKCGNVADAREVFERMPEHDTVSWNTMIAGYAQHGVCKESLELFEKMQQERLRPTGVTFMAILSGCCHGGFIEEIRFYFHLMSRDDDIILTEKHYSCMVDTLGRAGHLMEAQKILVGMPSQPSSMVWRVFFTACKIHESLQVIECTLENDWELEYQGLSAY